MKRSLFVSLIVVLVLIGAPAAFAATATAGFNATATVINNCRITAVDLAFGNYDPTDPVATDAQSDLTVRCTKSAPGVKITISAGADGSGTTHPLRNMLNGVQLLPFNIYASPANRTTGNTASWGTDLADATSYVGYTPLSNAATAVTMYGRIPPLTDVTAAAFTEALIATINF